ncbi:DUF2637 domain-containing protein [Streptomyces sp. ISL-100]|uniref:DUF2637 domain-containing protein n=1 Tax=Streptomyces sp. ISL-100 TaxID=2819173 RepID=UPI00203556ED|nr:DUF2637 domain-containing protein [Streptomyces sp. ISL-100]
MPEARGRHSRPPSRPDAAEVAMDAVDAYPYVDIGDQLASPLGALEGHWDPAEELAHLLKEAIETDASAAPSSPVFGESPVTEDPDAPLAGLAQITAELPPLRSAPSRRRRAPSRRHLASGLQTASFFLAALAAVVVSMVCVFGGMVAYDPLRHLAKYRTSGGAVRWWPLLVYGPWTVASLSILRAALHRRRAVHSWTVVLLFSAVSILLCVSQAPRTLVDVAAASLPSFAALACFQQLVRQITLTRPPRQAAPRHRSAAPSAQSSGSPSRTVT